MAYYTTTIEGLQGLPIAAKGVKVDAKNAPGFSNSTVVSKTTGLIGTSTGKVAVSTDNLNMLFWVEVKVGSATAWVWYTEYAIAKIPALSTLWLDKDKLLAKFSKEVSTKVKQAYLDAIVANDQKIFLKNLQNLKVLLAAKQKGKNTTAIENALKAVAVRYEARQAYMRKNTKATVGKWDSLRQPFNDFIKWTGLGQVNGLGVAPFVIAACIVGAVLLVGVGYLINTWLQPKYSESEADLKITDDLDKALKTLDPATRQAVINDLEGQIDTAFNQGKKDQKREDGWDITKYAGVAVASILFITVGIPMLQNAVKPRNNAPAYY